MATELNLICLVSLILFLVFETNVIVDYGRALNIKLPELEGYNKIIESGGSISYLKYLRGVRANSFWIKGLTCNVCFSVWLSLFISLVFFKPLLFPTIEIGGLFLFFLLKLLVKFSN